MYFLYFFFSLFGTLLAAPPGLFHGTSVVIIPSNETSDPGNSTILAANFFCYMGEKGYFSFGWWIPPSLSANTSHCVPTSHTFHWYEHAHLQSCTPSSCTYITQNYPVRIPSHAKGIPLPPNPVDYTIKALDIGNGDYGKMAVSYIDDADTELRVYGIGTREILGGEKCREALGTLEWVLQRWKPDLGFELVDICGEERGFGGSGLEGGGSQQFLGQL
ncbi:hypothetical protein GLAREA_08452 [Glarea lozoyensis ATCC 20868]|uniref:Uncharacterized protein n=1 Tax=Glarea lozoyensis (strain ATCC 20868 / MF5171) TaxID=1116229 RepID=S3CH30_GLAL2|nr:uncharacterized protein GLAREA_08452 [Glarea lozoyensis ATCC 20868]EPE24599.1 hypothetical protein GLAREA_08452 [Glarea lozoyensis ATCC 20868]